jgi:CubicO group peptidase (beta-lactamase class C family)
MKASEHVSLKDLDLDPDRFKLIEQRCQEWVERGTHPSLVVLISRHGKIGYHQAFGSQGPGENAGNLVADAVFPISSVCKPMVASLAVMLAEEGLLQLNGPVSMYLPEMTGEGTEMIRIDQLLTHTSGFHDMHTGVYTARKLQNPVDIGDLDETQHRSIERVLKARWDMPVHSEPGTRMDYCAHNYDLIGEVIRRVSGQSLENFAQERLFQPLGMHDSSFRLLDHLRDRIVYRPEMPDDLNSDKALDQPWASGGALSTASDLMKFGQLFLDEGAVNGERLLSRVSIKAMTKSQIPTGIHASFFRPSDQTEINFGQASYGLGWFVQGENKGPMNGFLQSPGAFAHSGLGGAKLWVDPRYDLVGIFLSVQLELMAPGASMYPNFQDMVMSAIL